MKKIKIFITCFGIYAGSIIYGVEDSKQQTSSIEEKNPNHFYFGPEFLFYQLNVPIDGAKVHGTRFFSGLRLGYEYLKPKAFYAGVDLLGTSTGSDFKASYQGHNLSCWKADRGFGNLELRFGYTFAPTNWLVSSFLGIGSYNTYTIDHHSHQVLKKLFLIS